MKLEVLTVGTDLLLGHTLDTNAAELGRTLAAAGVEVVRRTTVPDRGDAIRDAVAEALGRTGFVIATGGLGPMRDDCTKRAVAGLLGRRLVLDNAVLRALQARCRGLGRPCMPPLTRAQAEVPERAEVLPNLRGLNPGLWVEDDRGRVIVMLPGVPSEMAGMLVAQVLPRLVARQGSTPRVVRSRVIRTTCAIDVAVAEFVGPIEEEIAPLTVAYLPSEDGVDLRVTAWALPSEEADERLARAEALLVDRIGPHAYGGEGADLAAVVLELLRARGWRLAVADSSAGGLLGARLAAVRGASDTFLGGVVTCANAGKTAVLDVPPETLAAHGAASEVAVRAMVDGVRRRFSTEEAIAVAGIAGPTAGSIGKPLEMVWLAAATPVATRTRKRVFQGTREQIRHRSVQAALDLLRRLILDADVNFERQH